MNDMNTKNQTNKPKLFISYSHHDKKVVDNIDDYFKKIGINLTRDVRDIKYKASIKDFMQKIRDHDYTLMIISDSFLKSKNCMFEVLEIFKERDFSKRILQILLENARIFEANEQSKYINFWTEEYKKLEGVLKNIPPVDAIELYHELKHIGNIRSNIGEFLEIISGELSYPYKELKKTDYKEILDYIKFNIIENPPPYSKGPIYHIINKNGNVTELKKVYINYPGNFGPQKVFDKIKVKQGSLQINIKWSEILRLNFIKIYQDEKSKYNYDVEIIHNNGKKSAVQLVDDWSMLKGDKGLLFGETGLGTSNISFADISEIKVLDDTNKGPQNEDIINTLTTNFGIPLQKIEISNRFIYCLYTDFIIKVLLNEKELLIFKKIERNKNNNIEITDLPKYKNWKPPKDVILDSVISGKLIKDMRIEEVVMIIGPPTKLNEHIGIGRYWNWTHPIHGTLQFTSNVSDLILATTIYSNKEIDNNSLGPLELTFATNKKLQIEKCRFCDCYTYRKMPNNIEMKWNIKLENGIPANFSITDIKSVEIELQKSEIIDISNINDFYVKIKNRDGDMLRGSSSNHNKICILLPKQLVNQLVPLFPTGVHYEVIRLFDIKVIPKEISSLFVNPEEYNKDSNTYEKSSYLFHNLSPRLYISADSDYSSATERRFLLEIPLVHLRRIDFK